MEIRVVGAFIVRADRRTDGHGRDNMRISQLCLNT
jgi:hypothetical protein